MKKEEKEREEEGREKQGKYRNGKGGREMSRIEQGSVEDVRREGKIVQEKKKRGRRKRKRKEKEERFGVFFKVFQLVLFMWSWWKCLGLSFIKGSS